MKKQGGKKCLIVAIFLFAAFSFLPVIRDGFFAQASEQLVLISEVCWMGSTGSANDEWLELYNPTDENVSLEGWRLIARDGQPEIALEGVISAQGYFLLERTDDESVPDQAADMIYSGSLSNTGEILELYDEDDDLIDILEAIDSWPAGDNNTKQTMVLVDGIWLNSEDVGGSPGSNNKAQIPNIKTEEENDDFNETIQDEGKEEVKKEAKVIINEIYPNPPGSDREREFIEIKNIGEATVDLEGWRIEVDNKNYEFGKLDILYETQFGKTVGPGREFVIFRYQNNLVLNNSGGTVKIFKPGKKTAEDTLKYPQAPEGFSYVNTAHIDLNKISTSTKDFFLNSFSAGDWVWSSQISPGANNQVKTINTPPKAIFFAPSEVEPKREIFFDASDTIDEEGDELEFIWDFGDGVKLKQEDVHHTFLNSGEYEVILKVNDGLEESIFSRIIEVIGNNFEKNNVSVLDQDKQTAWFDELENDFYYPTPSREITREKISIKEAKNSLGAEINIEGVVLVKPGILGTQFFYIADPEAGIRIYNYKKEFPDLKIGDLINVQGEVVLLRDEITLKTSLKEDIEIIDIDQEAPIVVSNSEEIIKDNLGRLLKVGGRVVKKDLPRIYLDDGFGEIVLYFKSGINSSEIKKDAMIDVLGVLGVVSNDLVVFPRSNNDIDLKKATGEETVGEILGEEETKEWELPSRDKKGERLKYFITLIITGVVIVSIYFYKKEKATP